MLRTILMAATLMLAFGLAVECPAQQSRSNGELTIPYSDLEIDTTAFRSREMCTLTTNGASLDTDSPPSVKGAMTIPCGKEKVILSEPMVEFEDEHTYWVVFRACEIVPNDRTQSGATNPLAIKFLSACKQKDVSVRIRRQLQWQDKPRRMDWVLKSATPTPWLDRMRQFVRQLGYSDQVAGQFIAMVSAWQDQQQKPVVSAWQQTLDEARQKYVNRKITQARLVAVEELVVKEIVDTVSKRVVASTAPGTNAFELTCVISTKQAQCVGYSMLIYVLGNTLGFIVEGIEADVEELGPGVFSPRFVGNYKLHTATLIHLSDKTTVIADAAFDLVSRPFRLEETYDKTGNYWELKHENTSPGLYERLRSSSLVSHLFNSRGYASLQRRQKDQALTDFTRAIDFDPESAVPYNNRANVYAESGEFSQAIVDYTKAIEIDSKYVRPYYGRACMYSALGKSSNAILDYTKAIEIDPKYALAYFHRGNAYDLLGKRSDAMRDYNKAIETDPKLVEAYCARGTIYAQSGQHAEAIIDFNRATEIDPAYFKAYYNRAACYANSHELGKAKSDFHKALELAPNEQMKEQIRGAIEQIESGLQ